MQFRVADESHDDPHVRAQSRENLARGLRNGEAMVLRQIPGGVAAAAEVVELEKHDHEQDDLHDHEQGRFPPLEQAPRSRPRRDAGATRADFRGILFGLGHGVLKRGSQARHLRDSRT